MNLAEIEARVKGEIPEHPDDFLDHCLTLIAHAREDIPALIAEVRRLTKENRKLRERWAEKVVKEMPEEWGGADVLKEDE